MNKQHEPSVYMSRQVIEDEEFLVFDVWILRVVDDKIRLEN